MQINTTYNLDALAAAGRRKELGTFENKNITL